MRLLLCFFHVLRHTAYILSCAWMLLLYKSASTLQACTAVTENEKCNYLMLAVLSKSFVLRAKVPFSKSEVIALEGDFTCHFGLIDVS